MSQVGSHGYALHEPVVKFWGIQGGGGLTRPDWEMTFSLVFLKKIV